MNTYLAIDPAHASGYALTCAEPGENPKRLASGTLKFTGRVSLARQIYALLRTFEGVTHAIVEHPIPVYQDGKIRNLKGFVTHIGIYAMWVDAIFEVHGIRPRIVYPSEWQKALKSSPGGDTKARSLWFARHIYGYTPATHDEADALGQASYLHLLYGFLLPIEAGDPKAGIKRALNEYAMRKGGCPLAFMAEKEKRK
jgi:hypothetical protein